VSDRGLCSIQALALKVSIRLSFASRDCLAHSGNVLYRVDWLFVLAPRHRRNNKIMSVVYGDAVEPSEY